MTRQLHLNLFIHSRGHHEASWRHPLSSPLPLTDIRYYQDLAQRAEAGLFDALDHISNGRVGWNIVTSWLATSARNYGGSGQVTHADRYAQGEEFMTVVKGLWDSWAEDAVLDDRAGGHYANSNR